MDDFSFLLAPDDFNQAPETDFYIAMAVDVNSNGVRLLFAGDGGATTKYYKCLNSASISIGQRVVVMKISGTYVVLGTIGGGSGDVEIITNTSDIFSSITSGFTVSSPRLARYGKIAMFTTLITASTAGDTTNWKTWATLKDGNRPCIQTLANCQATTYCIIGTDGTIKFSLKESADYQYRISATYILA